MAKRLVLIPHTNGRNTAVQSRLIAPGLNVAGAIGERIHSAASLLAGAEIKPA
jgi:hypothetical protein